MMHWAGSEEALLELTDGTCEVRHSRMICRGEPAANGKVHRT